MPVVWYLYIFFICQLFVYLEAKMSTNWHFWRLLKMQTNSCIFVNKHHKNFLLGYFFIPYVYLNFDRKKNLEVYGMSRYLRHLQLILKLAKNFVYYNFPHARIFLIFPPGWERYWKYILQGERYIEYLTWKYIITLTIY